MGGTQAPNAAPVFTALVLAGARGSTDVFAVHAGHRHKALVPVAGVPMLVRVIRTLHASGSVRRIVIAIDDPGALDLPELHTLSDAGILGWVGCGRSPSTTVLDYLRRETGALPLLVTTADHPLLSQEMIDHFCGMAAVADADVVVGAVGARVFRSRYPHSKRTIIRLRDDGFSGANLFAFMTSQSVVAAAFWRRAEQFRKRPWRLVREFGLVTLVLFAMRRLRLESALARVSRAIGARIAVVQMPFAECAIDVDSPADLVLVSQILDDRQAAGRA